MMKRTLLSALVLGVALLLSVLLITACGGNGENGIYTVEIIDADIVFVTVD